MPGGGGERRMPDQATWACISENVIEVGTREARVQGHGDDAQPAAGIYQFDVLGPVGKHNGEAVPRGEPLSRQGRGDSRDRIVELPERRSLFRGSQRRSASKVSGSPADG